MNGTFEVRIEWLEAPGVTTPELAASWARYEIWLSGRCVTQVETADGTFRRSVYGSLYPLAYWIASNWWLLNSHIRPSAVDTHYWTWRNVRSHPWLAQHNFRGAGDGMAWPDLTLVPEGAITHIVWKQDYQRNSTPVRFASDGSGLVRVDEIRTELAGIVNHVLERLSESGLPKTPLAEEWSAVAKADDQEQEFCRTTARMGIDPYSVDDDTADVIIKIADQLPPEIVDDFFDTADVTALAEAAAWARRAMLVSERAAGRAANNLQDIYTVISTKPSDLIEAIGAERPWALGYGMARQLRHELAVKDTDRFDVSPWVGVGDVTAPSHGIYGFASVTEDRCGVVLANRGLGATATRFGQARALGRVVARPGQRRFVLSAARSYDERVARAFAAELLAPAEGIRLVLESIGKTDDSALEAVAQRFQVSPLVVRHQYENQIAALYPMSAGRTAIPGGSRRSCELKDKPDRLARYRRDRPTGQWKRRSAQAEAVEAQARNLQGTLVVTTLQMVAADPHYASSLAARLDTIPLPADGDVIVLDEHLRAWEEWLMRELRSNASVVESACEYARAWNGAELAYRVRAAAGAVDEDVPTPVLLAVAVAAFGVQRLP